MKKQVEVKPKNTAPIRERCGDCYYNGNCRTHLRSCPYLKKQVESTE